MPFPLLLLATPVLHSSGGWIASTAASGYLASTLSSTWISAFILGNSGFLSSVGLVSAAGIFSAGGGLAAFGAARVGSALGVVGLGGLAQMLGIAPVATFLGLTPIGWAITGVAGLASAGVYFIIRRSMKPINEERVKGGLEPITERQLMKEISTFETEAIITILKDLSANGADIVLSDVDKTALIENISYQTKKLRYVTDKDGSEYIACITAFRCKKRIHCVKPTSPSEFDH